jgi:hypothetical protein
MANPKPCASAVSLADLALCFEKCMNVPGPAPPAFNMECMRVVEERATNITLPSEESPHPTLKGIMMEEDIAWAKDHLKTH